MTLPDAIAAAMASAAENGYTSHLEALTDEQLTDDLMDCDADVAKFPRSLVLDAVATYRSARYRGC